jgi:hypothetical protein
MAEINPVDDGVEDDAELKMRNSEVPFCETLDSLISYIVDLVSRKHDYGTSVYVMSMAAVAAKHYAAHILGVSGFQASCADLDFIRRTRRMECPFSIIKADDELWPQYDIAKQVAETRQKWEDWVTEEARKKIEKADKGSEGDYPAGPCKVHPDVRKHWEKLAARKTMKEKSAEGLDPEQSGEVTAPERVFYVMVNYGEGWLGDSGEIVGNLQYATKFGSKEEATEEARKYSGIKQFHVNEVSNRKEDKA